MLALSVVMVFRMLIFSIWEGGSHVLTVPWLTRHGVTANVGREGLIGWNVMLGIYQCWQTCAGVRPRMFSPQRCRTMYGAPDSEPLLGSALYISVPGESPGQVTRVSIEDATREVVLWL